jgi:lysozyme
MSDVGYDLIKRFEGLFLKAYVDPGTGGKPYTIGWGTTIYPDGKEVQLGDTCTIEEAQSYLEHEVQEKTKGVYNLLDTDTLTQNQFDALVSFSYNCGLGNFKSSTLLKKAKVDPNDPSIRDEFKKWNKANKKVLAGLTRRRKEEADLYFS